MKSNRQFRGCMRHRFVVWILLRGPATGPFGAYRPIVFAVCTQYRAYERRFSTPGLSTPFLAPSLALINRTADLQRPARYCRYRTQYAYSTRNYALRRKRKGERGGEHLFLLPSCDNWNNYAILCTMYMYKERAY